MEKRAMRFAISWATSSSALLFVAAQPARQGYPLQHQSVVALRLRADLGRPYFGDFDPFGDFDLLFGAAN
jgi:hypothetical protein